MTPQDLYNDPSKIAWHEPIVIDFETYYDGDYSPQKVTTEKYIRCEQFECIGVSVKHGARPTDFFPRETGIDYIRRLAAANPASPVVAHNCLTGDHEVRTEHGWVRLDDLKGDERILQWLPETNKAEFVEYEPFSKDYVGVMYEYDTTYHKGIYTADHRVYFQNAYTPEWKVDTAENVAKRQPNGIYLPTGFIVEDGKNALFNETEILLLEAIRADGGKSSPGSVRFHVSRPHKIERLHMLAELLGLDISVKPDLWNGKDNTYYVRMTGELIQRIYSVLGHPKKLGSWVLDLPLSVRQAWLSEIEYWDGSRSSKHRVGVTTSDETVAYWLSELALFSGYMAHISTYSNTRGYSTPTGVLHSITIRNKQRAKFLERPKTYEYSGKVYCVSVPSKAFVVRRKGKVWVTGNCNFDLGILAFRYDIHPNFAVDTSIMAKLCGLDRVAGGVSLAKITGFLAERGILPTVKGTEVHNMVGVHADDMTREQWQAYGDYCTLDVNLTYGSYMHMLDKVPTSELIMADITTKMWTQSKFHIDVPLLTSYLQKLKNEKQARLESLAKELGLADVTALLSTLRSSAKFAQLLSRYTKVPTKWSEKKNVYIPAFAKTDKEFLQLLGHENPTVSLLVETKLGVSSSLNETRTSNFLDIASRGHFPVPLRYASAHTGRYGGGDSGTAKGGTNVQNLPKRTGDLTLRRSLTASEDHVVIASDSTQVELRVNALMANQQDLLDVFASGKDPYVDMATVIFNKSYDEIYHEAKVVGSKDGKRMRNLGKETSLACIGHGTEVLCLRGWVPIQDITSTDLLWDGEAWVSHDGVVPMGEKDCMGFGGAVMTPDHRVYDGHGWEEAQNADTLEAISWATTNLPYEEYH